jgi:CheY-like chemotaxis protein
MSRKLLLADDSITIQKVIGITFAHEDYELTVVDNGDAALQKALANCPDLVLADVFMPGKNGYELCAAIKGNPALAQVPVLLLSGTFEPFDEQKARDAGADSWISKPFESQALIARVEELLSRPQAVAAVIPQASMPMPSVATAAAAVPPQSAWDDAPKTGVAGFDEAPQELAADAWVESDWQDAAVSTPLVPEADLWQDPVGLSANGPAAEDFSWEEPSEAAPEGGRWQIEETPAELSDFEDEEDLWGAVSFGEEDLLGDFGGSSGAVEDLWGGAPVEDSPAILDSAPPVVPQPALTPAAPVSVSRPAVIEWEDDEEEILPLEDLDILEEEDLLDDELFPVVAAANSTMDTAAMEDPFDSFAGDEDYGLALQKEAVAQDFYEASAAAPFAMEDAWEDEEPLTAEDAAVRELLATSLHEPDWSSEISGGDYQDEEEEFLLNPAEVAMEAASQMPADASAEPHFSEEQPGIYLKEEDMAALVEKVAGSVIQRLAGSILERIAWEVVPELAESLIKDEIRRIKEEVE